MPKVIHRLIRVLGIGLLVSTLFLVNACDRSAKPASEHALEIAGEHVAHELHKHDETTSLEVADAWVRALPDNSKNTAAYLTIKNNSSLQQVLTAVRSPSAEKIEIHEVTTETGMMQMREIERLVLNAQQEVSLAPQAKHLMLMGLKKPLVIGDIVEMQLEFSSGEVLDVVAPVRHAAIREGGHHH